MRPHEGRQCSCAWAAIRMQCLSARTQGLRLASTKDSTGARRRCEPQLTTLPSADYHTYLLVGTTRGESAVESRLSPREAQTIKGHRMITGTRDALLVAAENLLRTRGYAAFSYADLAETVGIRKASIHHHFPTKEALGIAIVENYMARVRDEFGHIEVEHRGVAGRLDAFFRMFSASNGVGLLPLCGALAAEMAALPPNLQTLTQKFFEMQLKWLTGILHKGIANGEIPVGGGARQKAFQLLSVLEGASFINWATGQRDALDSSVVRLVAERS